MKHLGWLVIFLCIQARAQELFPNTEPASTLGKNVFAVRAMWDTYNEYGLRQRNQFAMRLMYGVTRNLTLYIQPSVSNHHGEYLPGDFTANHLIGNQIISYSTYKVWGRKYPYRFGGVYGFAKYRFLSVDGDHYHFRMAGYAAYSTAHVAHDEAEPNLDGDTGGFEGGVIATRLKNRFAASLTAGFILPNAYHETHVYDSTLTVNTSITYGKAFSYSLSLGYLLYPKVIERYSQPNYNVYLELSGKNYGQAGVVQDGNDVVIESPTLMAWNYVDAAVGVQTILNANTRIDLTVEFPLMHRSWDHFYPLFRVGVLHNFYGFKKQQASAAVR